MPNEGSRDHLPINTVLVLLGVKRHVFEHLRDLIDPNPSRRVFSRQILAVYRVALTLSQVFNIHLARMTWDWREIIEEAERTSVTSIKTWVFVFEREGEKTGFLTREGKEPPNSRDHGVVHFREEIDRMLNWYE